MTTISVLGDDAGFNYSKIAKLYGDAGWGREEDYGIAELEEMFKSTSRVFLAFNEEHQLIGFARVLSDRVSISWLAEVVVSPSAQRQGVGSALVKAVREEFRSTAIYTEALKGTEGFFMNCGISPKDKLVACSVAAEDTSKAS